MIWHDTATLANTMSKTVKDIRESRQRHLESNGTLEGGIRSRRTKPSGSNNTKKHLLGRLTIITNICYRNHHHHHHHHHVVLVARISLTLSRHSSLSFIALGRSSGQHPVSPHSCWMYVRTGRPAFARPCVEIHKSTSLMSSSLLLQQCPACLARLTWIVFVIGGRWPYSWCLVGCCRQDLFKIARSILV